MNAKIHKTQRFSPLNTQYSILLSIFCSLFSILSFSQTYEWDWGKRGGGSNMIYDEIGTITSNFRAEMIWDIVIDEQNNYYFLGKISSGTTTVDGNEVTTFGNNAYGNNIIITSFTCDGTYRWSRVIGGGAYTSGDHAHKLVLDNNGGIYVHLKVANTTGSNGQSPVYFSENDSLPYLTGDLDEMQEGYKKGFLLKYDTGNGNLVWRRGYQGDVNYYDAVRINHLQIDNNKVLHTIIGLTEGIHLEGMLNVEIGEGEDIMKYYLVKFDSTTGNLIGTPLLLPLEGFLVENNTSFRYDENIDRYYLAGWKLSSSQGISFNGVNFLQPEHNMFNFFISFNANDLDDWWYKQITGNNNKPLTSIAIDSNSDIYIGGVIYMPSNSTNTVFFGDHSFSSTYSGNRPFILKMNSQGEVQWSKIPSGYNSPSAGSGTVWALDVAVNGNEVALATQGWSTIWDNFSIDRPENHFHDPTLVRFNKQTGEVIGLHDIYGSSGYHYLTAVTADNDGNYVVGGAMGSSLFTNNPNGIPTLYNIGVGGYDFFMARLAATPCGTPVASNNSFEKQALKLYPNPTNGLVYIEAQNLQSYEVYNLLGQRLLSGNSEVINLQDLSKGTYIVKVKMQSGEVMTSKVIKQ